MARLLQAGSLAAVALACSFTSSAQAEEKRPNFLVIVADDLGFSDIGAFGSEIRTPNLDALAQQGVRMTQFHAAASCSPTRAMLLTGTDNHRAGLGSMAEMTSPNQRGKPGYEGYLRSDVATLAERLADVGYHTYFSGKWHLGSTRETNPQARGFEHSFAMLQGGHNHFGGELPSGTDRSISGTTYTEDGTKVDVLPAGFYSSDYFAAKLIDQLEHQTDKKPFFAYLAFTAPHWPLQAPTQEIAKYRGRYDEGFRTLERERYDRQRALGILTGNVTVRDPVGRHWSDLTDAEKRKESRTMEIYAGMIDRMDQNVGKVISALKKSGQYENTVIVFFSDNGADGMDLSQNRNVKFQAFLKGADNSLDNLGSGTSYVALGPGWAQAVSAPSWLFKGYATEGGTRLTAFISGVGVAKPGRISSAFTHVKDIVPTFMDLAGARIKAEVGGRPAQEVQGRSWKQLLAAKTDRVYPATQAVGTELFGSASLRMGDWKLVKRIDAEDWRLFNVGRDPGEATDLSSRNPAMKKKLLAEWERYKTTQGVVIPDPALRDNYSLVPVGSRAR